MDGPPSTMLILLFIASLGVINVPAVLLNDLCESDTDCETLASHCFRYVDTCQKGVCRCNRVYMEENGTCKAVATYDNWCDDQTHCTQDTVCTNVSEFYQACRCPEGLSYSFNLQMCTNQKEYGDTCNSEDDCFMGGKAMTCTTEAGSTEKTCSCKSGYVRGVGRSVAKCVLPDYGDSCTTACQPITLKEADSSVRNLTCNPVSGRCECPPRHEYVTVEQESALHKVCLKRVGTPIGNGLGCQERGDCSSSVCAACPGETTKRCQNLSTGKALGELCSQDSDCRTKNSFCARFRETCDKGVCLCKRKYEMADKTCKLRKSHGERCDKDMDFCDGESQCRGGICQCSESAPWNALLKLCTNQKGFGEHCSSNRDCYNSSVYPDMECKASSETSPKTCRCMEDHIRGTGTEANFCHTPFVGEHCMRACSSIIVDTTFGDATCNRTTNTCECAKTHEKKIFTVRDFTYRLCMEKTTPDLENGQECLKYGDCKSSNCYQCPGTTTPICQPFLDIYSSEFDRDPYTSTGTRSSGSNALGVFVMAVIAGIPWPFSIFRQ